MHLQNKHLEELTTIESQATPKTCKTRVLKEPNSSEEMIQEESIREYYSVSSVNDVAVESDSEEQVYMEEQSKAAVIKSIIQYSENLSVFLAPRSNNGRRLASTPNYNDVHDFGLGTTRSRPRQRLPPTFTKHRKSG